ncbi:serine threonine kinase [Apiospora marii]|uniref:Serine threonine kinase n=1 Tax=Apiospora marii TaxID=335849 RepID=A0ABR1RNG7_9PEZI
MTSIGRIQAGFAQASQELTVAAANLNFDFTLIKVEAPPEYQTIGNLLTPTRVREAETGSIHVTARKLGALFEDACPDTPNLIKAYGSRALEISKDVSEADLDSPGQIRNWIRTEFGGVDATSIWAAATSSKAAIPVHLLACIIARMWTHSEAISVWAEMVAERKKEILLDFEKGVQVPMALASAAQQEITRDHLGRWDASARAWLHTADNARQRQYKQFLLIIKNLSIAIHRHNVSLYKDVLSVWASALTATEGLISGKPHAVRDGPVLLGLSAWHIFPDMLVFNGPTGSIHVSMNDPLVRPGGVLSLGISDPAHREEQGVYWSLSLSHHMYYGEAVKRTRRLDVDGSRLTLNDLFLVCIGSLLRRWSIPKNGINKAIMIMQEMKRVVPAGENRVVNGDWRHVIEQSLNAYTAGDKEAVLAVSLGRRRPGFMPAPLTDERKPLFGLLHITNLLFLLKDPDRKIELLRRLAARVKGLDNTNSIIFCFDQNSAQGLYLQFATALPRTEESESLPSPACRRNCYHRWIQVPVFVQATYTDTIRLAKRERHVGASRTFGGVQEETDDGQPMIPTLPVFIPDPELSSIELNPVLNLRGGSGDVEPSFIDDTDAVAIATIAQIHEEENSYYRSLEWQDPLSHADNMLSVAEEIQLNEQKETAKDSCNNDTEMSFEYASEDDINKTSIQKARELEHAEWVGGQEAAAALEDAAERKYLEYCAYYLTGWERKLKAETIEYLRPYQQEITEQSLPSALPEVGNSGVVIFKGYPWYYDGYVDVITLEGESRDTFGPFFGQHSGSESLRRNSLAKHEHAVVYSKHESLPNTTPEPPVITMDDILWCFEHELIDPTRLTMLLEKEPAFAFLKVLAAVGEIYREPTAGGATISGSIVENVFDPPIFSKKLEKDDWADAPSYLSIDQTAAIALIGYFETGSNFIESMKGDYNIIGLSGADSIFVRTAILHDPELSYPDYSFTRILGNIGKPGLSILTSPSKLMVRKLDPAAWRIESAAFNGAPLDSFAHTSLHLSLTEWEAPLVQFQSVGQRDADVNVIEAVVSVRDAGNWVADVDICRALLSDRLNREAFISDTGKDEAMRTSCFLSRPGTRFLTT